MCFIRTQHLIGLMICAVAIFTNGCSQKDPEGFSAETKSSTVMRLPESPLAPYQDQLIELAYDTASAIPVDPHIKDRSKTQSKIVTACLELDQPERAANYLNGIENWQRGECFADLAFYYAQNGNEKAASQYIEKAQKVSDASEDWRKDRIRVRVAQVLILLGEYRQAEEIESGSVESEVGKLAQVKAMVGKEDSFENQMKVINSYIATGTYDLVNNALYACVELFNRFYTDEERRKKAEEKLRYSWDQLPIIVRMQLLMDMARAALEHEDQTKALELIDDAQHFLDNYQWRIEDRVALSAPLAELRFKAGDKLRAHEDADNAWALFKEKKGSIIDIWRAGAIRPLAEAYQTMGETSTSLAVYKTAVEEGALNPNSRPRAEDLTATCISMARQSVEPDEELWGRLHEIRKGLRSPW